METKKDLKKIINEDVKKLECNFDHAKSFYNKAHVKITSLQLKNDADYILYDGIIEISLYSYNTKVLTIKKDLQHYKDAIILYNNIFNNGLYSVTTLRHIKECLKQYYTNLDVSSELYYINAYTKKHIFNSAIWQ